MYDAFLFTRGIAIGLISAIILVTIVLSRQYYSGRMLVLFSVCVMCYLLGPLLYDRFTLFFLTEPLSSTTPLAFLLLTQALFEDHKAPARISLLFGGGYLGLIYIGSFLESVQILTSDISLLMLRLGRGLMLLVLAYSIITIIRHWKEDLIEPRRFLRLIVTGAVGVSIIPVVIVETLPAHVLLPVWVNMAHTFIIIFIILSFSVALMLLGPSQFIPLRGARVKELGSVEKSELELILAVMEIDKLFRRTNLSITALAEQLDIPVHRLRSHINTQLGYRNFNDFLNYYRVEDVSEKLSSNEMARVPILNIAMDSGYQSLTTFNKAFKALKGVTPKEYRRKRLADS